MKNSLFELNWKSIYSTFTHKLSFRLSSTIAEINLAMAAINLPVIEPLTPSKLDDLCSLSMASLYCAVGKWLDQ